MGDSDQAHMARALKEISTHLRELVRVQAALNENVLSMAKNIKDFTADFHTVSVVDTWQLTLDDQEESDASQRPE